MNEPTSDTPPSPGSAPDGVSRRAALVVPAGAGVLALSACGGSSEGGGAGGEAAGPIELPTADVPVGGGVVREGVVVTQPTEGEFHAFDARCPHQGCAVTRIDAESILCPCHGSTFDGAGRVYKNKPAPTNLEVPPHRYVSDTRILIGEDDAKA